MVKIKRVIILSVIVITILCGNIFAACSNSVVCSFEEVKQEFSQYEADLNTAVLLDFSNLYFYDRTIRLEEMVPEEIFHNFQIINDNIYFTVGDSIGWNNAKYVLYKCDLYGNNLEWLFKKENIKSVKDTFNGNVLYVQYEKKGTSEKIIDSYNLFTGEYANVAHGEDCDINNYKEVESDNYSCEFENKNHKGNFTIIDNKTSETFVVDDEYIMQTPYYQSLSKYPYRLGVINEYKRKLYITYILEVVDDASDPFPDYTVVAFEFDFETKELKYKTIVQMYDIEVYLVINVEG